MRLKSLILIWILMANAMFLSGCGSKFVTAYNTTKGISQIIGTAGTTVGELFSDNSISYEMKENIINKLKFIQGNNENVFLKEIDAVWSQYKNNPPKSVLSKLDLIFSTAVIAPLLDLITYIGAMGLESIEKLKTAIAVLKAAIFSIAAVFGASMSEYKLGESKSYEAILPTMDVESFKLAEGLV